MKSVRTIYYPACLKRAAPARMRAGDQDSFENLKFSTFNKSDLLRFDNVLLTSNGVIFQNFKPYKALVNCFEQDFQKYWFRFLIKVLLLSKGRVLSGKEKYLLVYDNYSGPKGFFHWISDCLTRLVEIKDEINEYVVIVPFYFKNEQLYQETLSLFNIKRIEYIEEKEYFRISNMYSLNYIAPSGIFRPENVQKLRDHVWNKLEVKDLGSDKGEKIYISRAKASRRKVLNEEEVTTVLKNEYGFSIVYLEDFSFFDQVKIMYHAKYLVGIHGGGLTHIHFLKPGSGVLELRKENDFENNVYYFLADSLSVNYNYLFCEHNQISSSANNFDLKVEITELRKSVEDLLTL
ncbi:glycosyltransferase family 61 protein [Sporocytophaga myxococcoides]|uniref:glycosyltransferase family 61 protein n=1 Tax=Sporocytophaga myxococcoides TaxID=153721 RepID=UPI000406C228|nr:glycosyltransferase 61 family protein [Sporocytophaga myxococcoides]